ncbi:uncharacterized protein LOC133829801 [Humulus lupulus]|uniref:uncharacterized protein LOC133829801 n=1 Tax=Humulus lupulus TaxID=3486 RepID=UPI002B402406|nr:uncharacterized protein LOC133829801 [Humulus lupulus]XP_062115580.1 uncharacterized protein LOC133829801 [Humulus lupulus]
MAPPPPPPPPFIISKLKKLWDVWNLRGFITLSLSLQIFLVLFASSRQRSKNSFFISLIWAAYLLADWVAAFAIGLITQIEDNDTKTVLNQEIYAFWAAFLLVHLGGPDSITSFALEDNEFWIRHLFGLIIQAIAAAYSFYLTPSGNKLWPCTVLVFFAGIVKYVERTRALYLASLDYFGRTALPKPEPGIDYEQASSIYSSNLVKAPLQGEITSGRPRGSTMGNPYFELDRITSSVSIEIRQLRVARLLFERFKGLIVGFFLNFDDRKSSREYFLKADYKSAFRVLEYELSFMFQVLHTKTVVVNQRIGYIFRFISFLTILSAAVYFLLVEKHHFGRLEIFLTYALLIAAIALEIISITVLICSDWTLVLVKDNWTDYVPSFILRRQRWSRLISQYNMISYCLDEPPMWFYRFAKFVHVDEILDNMKIRWYSSSHKVPEDLQEFIFVVLQKKSEEAFSLRDAREACLQRGDSALLESTIKNNVAGYLKLKWSVGDFKYAESVLLWHIATEICCLDETTSSRWENKRKRYCKILSDYMFYLLIAQPTMLSTVLGDWHVAFQDTCAEGKRFFKKYSILDHSMALDKMKSTKSKFRSAAVKGTKSKSVFFDACMLAQQLLNFENERWTIMDRVWVEFMSYAAINCRPIIHAQQPSRGGELLTFTWLLMNHLGLGTQFSEQEDQPGMKRAAVK